MTRDEASPTPPRSPPPSTCRSPPTWRTSTPTTRQAAPRPYASRSTAGLAGCSIEDYTGDQNAPLYDRAEAAERVAAAAEAAHSGPIRLVLTARAEGYLRGRTRPSRRHRPPAGLLSQPAPTCSTPPSITKPDELRELVASVDKPVNVLALPGVPTVAELAELGVKRISIGGAFAFVAYNALIKPAANS